MKIIQKYLDFGQKRLLDKEGYKKKCNSKVWMRSELINDPVWKTF